METFDNSHYVAKSEADLLKQRVDTTIKNIKYCLNNNLNKFLLEENSMREFLNFFRKIEENRSKHNSLYVKKELEDCKDYFDTMLQYPLGSQQREAVVNGEDNAPW